VIAAAPTRLSSEDKLDLLRYLDEFHFWHSIDDKRFCKRCGRSITGRQILVMELQGRRGQMRLQCPTVGCVSTPSEWVYADPVQAASLKPGFQAFARQSEATPVSREQIHHNGHAHTVHRVKRANENHADASAAKSSPFSINAASFRDFLGRLVLLRPLVSRLHAIHPVT
jgi:hypothetical protein